MLAGIYKGNQTIEVEDVPVPSPGADEVLIEVSHCGICGTDLHFVMEGWGRPGSIGGHEYSGVITAVGAGVDGWAVGDRVVGGPGRGCGVCAPCASGSANLCLNKGRPGVDPFQGAFAEFKALPAECAYPVPDDVDLRTAALSEPVAVALRGVRRAGVGPGSRVLVTGAGPIGLLTVAVLRALGVDGAVVSEPSPVRRAQAARVGAARVIEPGALQAPALPMDVVDDPFHAAIECSGRASAVTAALAQLGKGGTLVLSGTGMDHPRLDTNRVILNELVVTGTAEYTPVDFSDAIGMLRALPTELLIDNEDVSLSGMTDVMARLVAGEIAGKVLVVPRA